jgi:hypothetical protein
MVNGEDMKVTLFKLHLIISKQFVDHVYARLK